MKLLIIGALVFFESSLGFAANYFPGSDIQVKCRKKAERMVQGNKSLTMICRERENPNIEQYVFCDGRSCTGFSTDSSKSCRTKDWWHGPDDQEYIDPVDWAEECLVKEDFPLKK